MTDDDYRPYTPVRGWYIRPDGSIKPWRGFIDECGVLDVAEDNDRYQETSDDED